MNVEEPQIKKSRKKAEEPQIKKIQNPQKKSNKQNYTVGQNL
jgi:hypothetical protein